MQTLLFAIQFFFFGQFGCGDPVFRYARAIVVTHHSFTDMEEEEEEEQEGHPTRSPLSIPQVHYSKGPLNDQPQTIPQRILPEDSPSRWAHGMPIRRPPRGYPQSIPEDASPHNTTINDRSSRRILPEDSPAESPRGCRSQGEGVRLGRS